MSFKDLRANRASRQTTHAKHEASLESSLSSLQLSTAQEEAYEDLYQDHLNDIQWDFNAPRAPPSTIAGPSKRSYPAPSSKGTTLDEEVTRQLGLAEHGLEVRLTKQRGRGLFAGKKGFKAGDRILKIPERAVASALSTGALSSHCSGCYLSPDDVQLLAKQPDTGKRRALLRCAGCKTVFYCSKTSDWQLHAPECKTLSILSERDRVGRESLFGDYWIPLEYFRALARLVWARKKWRDSHPGEGEYHLFLLMQRHLDTSPQKLGEFAHVATQLHMYLSISSAHDPKYPQSDLVDLTSRLQTNAFTLTAGDLAPIGVLFSPPAAMSNHSCYPNAVVGFPFGGGKVEIIALSDIESGEEILTTYTDASYPRSSRQAELLQSYGFHCTCSLCEATSPDLDPPAVDARWCLAHAKCSNKGRIPMPKAVYPQSVDALFSAVEQGLGWKGKAKGICDGCGEQVEMDITELPRLVKQAQSYLDLDDRKQLVPHFGSREKAIAAVLSTVTALDQYMPAHSFPILPLLRLHFRLYLPITSDTIDPAIAAINRACVAAPESYPPNYPALAVLYSERATFLHAYPLMREMQPDRFEQVRSRLLLQRITESYQAATQALEACEKSFGSAGGGGILGRRLEEIVLTCEGLFRQLAEQEASGGQRRVPGKNALPSKAGR